MIHSHLRGMHEMLKSETEKIEHNREDNALNSIGLISKVTRPMTSLAYAHVDKHPHRVIDSYLALSPQQQYYDYLLNSI